MGVSAELGPIGTFQTPQFDSNPQAGPNFWHKGDMLADPRTPYSYVPGQSATTKILGWFTSTAIPLLDQVPSAVAANNIVNAQSPVAGTPLTLVSASGAGITVGCSIVNAATGQVVSGLLGIDVNSAAAPQPLVGFGDDAAINVWNPAWAIARCLALLTNADDTGGFYTVNGYDEYFFPLSQKVTGVNNTTANTLKAFKYIASIVPSGTINSTAVSVGTTDTYGLPLRTDRFPYLSAFWGTPQAQIGAGTVANQTVVSFGPILLSSLANGTLYEVDMPFDGKIISAAFRVAVPATTAAKAATLTAQANGVSVTGGAIALTSANATPTGNKVAGSAITAGNAFAAGQTVGVVVSGVTAFVEGSGTIELTVQNTDDSGGVFTAADTTTPATQTTGDVRGTFATPTASDGTKRLTIFWTPIPANMTTNAGLVGVTQV